MYAVMLLVMTLVGMAFFGHTIAAFSAQKRCSVGTFLDCPALIGVLATRVRASRVRASDDNSVSSAGCAGLAS